MAADRFWHERGRQHALTGVPEWARSMLRLSDERLLAILREWEGKTLPALLGAQRAGADFAARLNLAADNRTLSPGHCAAEAEAAALRDLTAGFREAMAELAQRGAR